MATPRLVEIPTFRAVKERYKNPPAKVLVQGQVIPLRQRLTDTQRTALTRFQRGYPLTRR
ncbi:hypothetical protein KKA02_01395 [Patescibacteria group bacterium]|nr:hypothetical protein [Patescibacteria group bacterium]